MSMLSPSQPIRIIGNGLAAAVAALGLAQQGHGVIIDPPLPISANTDRSLFERPLALADSSLQMIAHILGQPLSNCLSLINATAITAIHVSEQGHINRLKLRASRFGLAQFGAVVSATQLLRIASQALDAHPGVTIAASADADHIAALTIIANGANSPEREALGIDMVTQPYRESALTGLIRVTTPQPSMAFERFSADGPLALLPFGDQYAYVLTVDNRTLDDFPNSPQFGNATADQIAQLIEDRLGKRLGTITDIQPQARFPLTLRYANRLTTDDTVLLGNTALSIHPIAGQGYNLVVRDIAWLMEYLSSNQPIANSLAGYARERRRDHQITRHFTHSLVTLFDQPWLWAPRGLGLGIANWSPTLQRLFMDIGGGQLTRQPKLRFGISP